MLAFPQVYRNSVIAQWKALDLDVLLTPMLGPALNLNAPGRATGEACCPICSPHTPTFPFSSMGSYLSLVELLEVEEEEEPQGRSPRGGAQHWRRCPLLWGSQAAWLAGEMGVMWDALGGDELPVICTVQVGDL